MVELVGFHAKDPEVCKWVIEMFGQQETDNGTVRQWVQACRDRLAELESLSDGPELGSIGQAKVERVTGKAEAVGLGFPGRRSKTYKCKR